jgi:RND family efflux transporter MFP subunit
MNKSKKNVGITVILIVVIAGVGSLVSQQIAARSTVSEASATETAVVQRGDLSVTIEAAGSLAPHADVALAFTSGGRVAEALVIEGQQVEAGQSLVRLETDDLTLQVAQAEAALAAAEAQLAQLLAPPRPEEIAAQKANLQAMQAQVSAAAANWDQFAAGISAAQIAAYESQVASAQAQHKVAQDAHDRTIQCRTITLPDGTETEVCPGLGEREEEARYNLYAADAALAAAQAQLDAQLAGADDQAREVEANVWAATAQRDAAQAQLDLLLAGAADEQIQSARAAVEQARVALNQAQLRLKQATLTAPIAGTVTTLKVQPGEMSSTGQSAVVVSDLTALEAEVNLDETDVSRIQMGMTVLVSVDAFPGQPLTGQVTEIALSANVQSGVVLYPVTVRFDPADLPLRSDMTVNVTFPIEQRTDTLLVPFRAVETEDGQAYVTRVTASGSERVAVTLGLITDTQVEISSGLNEGDVVTVFANPVQDTEIMKNPIFGGGQ